MLTLLRPHPAVMVKAQKTRTMVITDLHIGWEMALSKKGIYVPTQMPKLLGKLTSLIFTYKPDKLLILGDVKHTVATAEIGEWHDLPDFFNELKRRVGEVCIIRGNHDGNLEPLLPEKIKLNPATGMPVGDVGFFHGHQWPSPSLLKCRTLIMGHAHPVVAFRDPAGFRATKQVWVKTRCDGAQLARFLLQKHKIKTELSEEALRRHYEVRVKTEQLFVMPSFNELLGGRPLNERKPVGYTGTGKVIGPVLNSPAVNIENAEVYLLDGTPLGTIDQLRNLS